MELRDKLISLGLRETGHFTLKSGATSPYFWNIEKLFKYPDWIIEEALREFTWQVGLFQPEVLLGVQTGGYWLAKEVGRLLGVQETTSPLSYGRVVDPQVTILVDDVITTGDTIKEILDQVGMVRAVAVLVNRSGLDEIEGFPIITGIYADKV